MTKASDNAFPSVLITEGTEPTAPAAGKQRLYIDSTSHHLSAVNSSGTERDLESASGSTTATAHGARVKRSSGNVSVGNNTLTVVGFNTEDYDTDTMHDNSTNPSRLTIPSISGVTTGLWAFKASGYTDVTSGRTDAMFRKNANAVNSGGTICGFSSFTANSVLTGFILTIDMVLSATDYIELFVRTTGGAGNVTFDADASPLFEAAFLGKVT